MISRPSLTQAIQWIALNDNAGNGDDVSDIAAYISTAFAADLFGVSTESIAPRILAARQKFLAEEAARQ